MKHYPSIIRINSEGFEKDFYTFDKLDGSQIRASWSHKTGWFKFGTRTQLLDKNDPVFGSAIPIFMETLAEPLAKIAYDNKWINIVAFCEFYGEKSLAGKHVEYDDDKKVTLFDVSVYRYGMLEPEKFVQYFGHLPVAKFLGIRKWNKEFVEQVRNSSIDGLSMEGCVGKNNDLKFVKCKTQRWLDTIKKIYPEEQAIKIINS